MSISTPAGQPREWATLGLATLAFLLTAFYFAPCTAFLFNGNEVTIPVGEVVGASWAAQVGMIGFVAVLGLVGCSRVRRPLAGVLLALAALLYIQGNVFVWDYGTFDGSDIDWVQHRNVAVFEAVVWVGVVLAAIIFSRKLWRFLPRIALALVLLNAASLGSYVLSGRSFDHATASGVDDDLYQFSSKQNTLIVIMDAFASPAFDLMLADDPSWRDRLDGFTYYRDALGVYPTTLPSIPAILSGKIYDNSVPVKEFLGTSLSAGSLPTVLREEGFRTHTITEAIYGEYLAKVPFASQISFLDNLPVNRKFRDALRIWNVTLFRYSPHFLKMQIYSDHRWLLHADEPSAISAPFTEDEGYRVPSIGQRASWILWKQLLENAEVGSAEPTFKFLHFFTTHTPFFLGKDCDQITTQQYGDLGWEGAVVAQSTCAMNQVLEILNRLNNLGVLDQTLVILAGDHGSHIDLVTQEDDGVAWDRIPEVTRVLPLLLVKPVGADGPMKISEAPVSLIDIPSTVAADMGIEFRFPGRALQGAAEGESRSRTYYQYTWEHDFWWADHLPPMTGYQVDGPAREPSSWSEGRPAPAE